MKEAIIFENSALSEYCETALPVEQRKNYLLQDVLKKYNLSLEDTLITDRQYLEISGKGQVRAEILKEYKEEVNAAKPCINVDIQNTFLLQNYIEFLENLFSKEIRVRLPRCRIHDILKEKLKKYPLDTNLDPIKRKLHSHGSSLFKFSIAYERFINTLVEDSVTRCALDFLNFKEIPRTQHNLAMQLLNSMISTLMTKYVSSQVMHTNLNLLTSGLKTAILSQKNPQSRVCPMFRIEDDIADIEPVYFMLYGANNRRERIPVTIVTKEPKSIIIERLNYNMISTGVKAEKIEPQTLLLGRIILLDFNNFTHDVITGEYLQKNFKTSSGQPLF